MGSVRSSLSRSNRRGTKRPKVKRAKRRTRTRAKAQLSLGQLVQGVFEHSGTDTPRLAHHRRQLRDDVQRLPALDHPLELRELALEPVDVDRRACGTQDLRVSRRPYGLAFAPELLVQLLARDRKSTRLNSSHVAISYAVF